MMAPEQFSSTLMRSRRRFSTFSDSFCGSPSSIVPAQRGVVSSSTLMVSRPDSQLEPSSIPAVTSKVFHSRLRSNSMYGDVLHSGVAR